MIKKEQKTSPNMPGSYDGELVNDKSLAEVKELSFEDTALEFKSKGGKWRISLRQIAEYYDIAFSYASQKLTLNPELFLDLGTDSVTLSANGSAFDYDLSIRDAISFLTLLPYKRYEDERREKLIRMRIWLSDNAEKILTGEIPSKDYAPSLEELERMDGVYTDHSFLTGMVTNIVRKIRKKDPHVGCPSEQEIYQEDFNDVLGPGKLIPNWRKGLNKSQGKDLTVKKFFQGSNFLAGHIRGEDNRKRVIEDIEEYCPQYKPEYMPSLKQLDPTRQMTLMAGEEA